MNHILSLIFPSLAWRRLAKALVFAVLALSISACSSDDDDDDDANKAPTSNAGEDQSVAEGTTGVTLDGSGSSDSDGTIEKYAWTLTTSNDDVTLTGADTATASFTAPEVDADTELVFRLTVTDNDGATATDDVTITVTDSTSGGGGGGGGGENAAPTANAGDDQDFFEGDEVTLAGSGSDSDGTIASYAWSHVTSNSGVTLSGENTATASFTAPGVSQDEEMVFRLTVTDDDGETHYDDVTVNVLNSTSSSQVLFASQYELKGASQEPYANSQELGDVYGFSDSDGGFVYGGWGLDSNAIQERQLYGLQFVHNAAVDENSFFGLTVKAPANGALDISATDTLVIQLGSGVASDTTHMVFVVDMNGGEQDPSDFSWTHSCSYEQELLEGSQPGDQFDPAEAWDNNWGVQTYRIPLVDFDCGDSELADIKIDLEEVAVKVVGGVDEVASAVTDNYTLLQIGYIGFSDDNAPLDGDSASPYIMFASQYELKGSDGEPYAHSQEGGDIYGFSDADGVGFEYADGTSADDIQERQAYGVQYYHLDTVDSSNYFGLTVKAPNNGALDISETNTLVIQMGNGVSENSDAFPNSHMTFTIDLNGGEQDTNDFSWSHSCSYDQELLAGSRPGSDEAWDNGWGIQTYRIPLDYFNCGDSNLVDLQADLEEVVIKVIGGKDETASSTTTNGNGDPGNHTLLHFGYIAFASDAVSTDEPSE